jgi:hypothetical protein
VSEHTKIYQTPAGIAQYPWLTRPDTTFDPRGHYKVTLLVSTDKAQPLIEVVDEAMVQSLAKARKDNPAKAKIIKPTADKPYGTLDQHDHETGDVSFHFRLLAKSTNMQTGETRIERPALFDAKVRPLDPTKVNIDAGSTIKVAFEMHCFYVGLLGAGVSLRLRAVQVLKLVESPGRHATAYGFVEEDVSEAGESHRAE